MAWMVHINRSKMWLAVAVIIQLVTCSEQFGRHLNPQTFLTTFETIQSWGYPCEQHDVKTDDDYFLKLNRIPYGLHGPGKKGHNPVVLLIPGLISEDKTWISNLPNNSIGFALADAGYDVWMLNYRGTLQSRRHQNLSTEQEEYWDFTFHEIAIFDIPATINFILTKTKQEALYVMAQSHGGIIGLITLSVLPELAPKVKLFMLFAPSYTMAGSWSPTTLFLSLPDSFKRLLWGKNEFCPLPMMIKFLNANLCSYAILDQICLKLLSISFGSNEKNTNVSRMDVYSGGFPDCSSFKTILHMSQVLRSGELKHFDYGSNNKAVYKMTTPPLYKLEDVTVPTALWSAGNDIIVNIEDTRLLLPRLTHLVFYKHIPDWQHADFLLGLDAPEYLYPDMFWLMEQYK